MALKLQTAGYVMRFVTYSNDGFEEGVSLTVYDELARWEKYAFGCSEMVFNPIRTWPWRGPFSPLIREFFCSSIGLSFKITTMAYIGTYYALGASWILTLGNYFLTGWFFGMYDKYYLDSFSIWFSVIVVFPALGNFSLATLRYRLSHKSFIRSCESPSLQQTPTLTPESVVENLMWAPAFSIFFGGLSLHISKALLCHFFEIDIQWGATAKEVERVNFFTEVPRLLRKFAGTFVFCIACTALMVCGRYAFPRDWQITYVASILPLAVVSFSHFALPVLLNPALMKFSF